MENPFGWPRELFYTERKRSDFDTKNPQSLDCLLKQMYMAECQEEHPLIKLETAMDAAYYIAVCLANMDYVDEFDWRAPVHGVIERFWTQSFVFPWGTTCPYAQKMLLKWMVYAILYLQETQSEEMVFFLDLFRRNLEDEEEHRWRDLQNPEDDRLDFLSTLPTLIEQWPYTYSGNLSPRPTPSQELTKDIWANHFVSCTFPVLEQQLQLYPTVQEQQAFLDWVKQTGDDWSLPF